MTVMSIGICCVFDIVQKAIPHWAGNPAWVEHRDGVLICGLARNMEHGASDFGHYVMHGVVYLMIPKFTGTLIMLGEQVRWGFILDVDVGEVGDVDIPPGWDTAPRSPYQG